MEGKMIGFIGLGNMASAIIGGMLQKQVVTAQNIIGSDKTAESRERAREKFNILTVLENADVARRADILFLAVKPIFMEEVIAEIRDEVRTDTLVVSIAAGKDITFLQNAFGRSDCKLIRCMPNTPALVMEGCTGVCANANVSEEELNQVVTLLRSFGVASIVPERLMDVVVGVSGSSPAYVFMFIEAMADAAVSQGLPRQMAYNICAAAVEGSALMVQKTGKHPGELKDMVCSPGGTTIEAVSSLEADGFRASIINDMAKCAEKSKKLTK